MRVEEVGTRRLGHGSKPDGIFSLTLDIFKLPSETCSSHQMSLKALSAVVCVQMALTYSLADQCSQVGHTSLEGGDVT